KNIETLIDTSRITIDSVLALPQNDKSYDTVVEKLAHVESELENRKNILAILISASADEELIQSYTALSEFSGELDYRADLYEMLDMIRLKENSLDWECDLYLKKTLLRKKRNGVHLPEEQREQIKHIDREIVKQSNHYRCNITKAEQVIIMFDQDQLKGMSPEFLQELDITDGKYTLTLKKHHVVPILKYCSVISTRQRIEKNFNSKCIESNVEILENIIKLRHQRAQILGYATYVDFITDSLLSKSADNVFDFLISLSGMLVESFNKERQRLLHFKQKECKNTVIEFDPIIYPYDLEYYKRMVLEVDLSCDINLIKQYFPLRHVTEQLLETFESFFHVRFYRIRKTPIWHPKVKMYSVCDQDSKKLLGYFYLDLYMRPGKYNGVACFPIQCALTDNNHFSLTRAALMANFPKNKFKKESLLSHDAVFLYSLTQKVISYFHEFGHLMHQMTCKIRYTQFDGLSTEKDFVEAPSQMLENMVWDPEVIKKLSCHYQTKEKMSDELIANLCLSRNTNISLYYSGQIVLSMFDFKIHSSPNINFYDIYKQCSQIFMLITPSSGTNFAASFRHTCSGYEAQYYGYLWSEIIACDIYCSIFKAENTFKPESGSKYRKYILEPGSTKNGNELFQNFM
ncbi:hypothetical protein MXB_2817, partial [Myxobolus squamalis]